MKISNNGIKLIQKFEGCRLVAYDDLQPNKVLTGYGQVRGTLTIGYGHTAGVYVGQKITKSDAVNLLKKDLEKYENIVNKSLKVPVTQNMFDALVSHCYNCGNVKTIATYLNYCDINRAIDATLRPNTSKGIVLTGLTIRRKAERDLFTKDMYSIPTKEINQKTATYLEVMWLQKKLKIIADGKWGKETENAIITYRSKLGWTSGNGKSVTKKMINKLK